MWWFDLGLQPDVPTDAPSLPLLNRTTWTNSMKNLVDKDQEITSQATLWGKDDLLKEYSFIAS